LVKNVLESLVAHLRLHRIDYLRHLGLLLQGDALHPVLRQSHFLRALLMRLCALFVAAGEVRGVVFYFAGVQIGVPSCLKFFLLPLRSLLGTRLRVCLAITALALRQYVGKDEPALR